ncbi:MAG: PAS domain S-box protein [Gemmatimonadota bacterium]|nr:MAG: PAS domain S-box protein [Gemmatimonadota bacterium]
MLVPASEPERQLVSGRSTGVGEAGTAGAGVDQASSRQPTAESWMGAGAWRGARGLEILRWVYMARLGLAGGVFAAAVFMWAAAAPTKTLAATLALVVTLIHTPASYWYTHIREQRPGTSFFYGQAVLDVVLVTLVVDTTGGSQSVVSPLYILLISAYTLLLPLRSGLLVTLLACVAYIADVVWAQGTTLNMVVALQLGIFVSVALVVGLIGTKLRETGAELSSMEDALEQLRLDTGDILGNIPTAVLTIDGGGRLAYANPAAQNLLGISLVEWLDRPIMEQLGRCSTGLRTVMDRTLKHRIPVASAEVRVQHGGADVPVGISTAVLERRDGPPSVTAIMRDISDRVRMERLRQRTERLEAVAELSASLAHEIKNPLASISSSVQQLGLGDGVDEDDRLLSQLILKESDRLSRLLSDFIDFARVHVERTRELDLRHIVSHALQAVQQHPDYSEDVEIRVSLEEDPVLFEGDEELMHRVVTNLVLNAMQAAEADSKTVVDVEVRNAGSDSAQPGIDIIDPVILQVADNGPGIEENDLKRIFDPFFTKRRGGSGLGLAIVHRAVREHRGTVLVASSPEAGTRFTVCLPSKRAPAPTEVAGEKRS